MVHFYAALLVPFSAALDTAQCVAAHRQLGEVFQIPHHLAIEASIDAASGHSAEAERRYSDAEQVIEVMLTHAPSAGSKKGIINAMSEIFVGHFELASKYQKNLPKAYEVIEEARGRILADRLGDGKPVAHKQSVAESNAERHLALIQMRLLDTNDAQERAELSDSITSLETELPTPDQPQRTAPMPLRELQSRLANDEAFLEYVLGPKKSYCIVVTRDSVSTRELPNQLDIDTLTAKYLDEIKSRKSETQTSQSVFRALIAPIPEYRQKRRLIIVPDGSLNRIPFNAVRDETGELLIRSHEVSSVSSGTVLVLMRSQPRNIGTALLAVGDVAYHGDTSTSSSWGAGIFRGTTELRRDLFFPLPSTQDEIQSIRSSMGSTSVVLAGEAATEGAFKLQAGRNYETIHLALHAVADRTYPDRAALIFASEKRSDEDGLLQVREIRKLPLRQTDLVTLSACDTSVGQVDGQEGMSSIVYAFLYAGAHSAVASLWTAEDSSTAHLMKAFYRHLSSGESKGEALRNAQLEFIDSEGQPPFYWASFQLFGDASGTIANVRSTHVTPIAAQ